METPNNNMHQSIGAKFLRTGAILTFYILKYWFMMIRNLYNFHLSALCTVIGVSKLVRCITPPKKIGLIIKNVNQNLFVASLTIIRLRTKWAKFLKTLGNLKFSWGHL